MKLEITKSGSFLSTGNTVSFIKGINKTIDFINNNSNLEVSMEVEKSNKFVNIFNKITNVNSNSLNSELINYGELIIFKFNFKTL